MIKHLDLFFSFKIKLTLPLKYFHKFLFSKAGKIKA